jgi:hypothetical protein
MHSKEEVKQQMFDKIVQWQQSGLTQKAYCQQNNIAYHVFHYYYGRFRIKDNDESSSFIKLQVAPCYVSAHTELVLPDGKRLLFHQGVSADFLKVLIS